MIKKVDIEKDKSRTSTCYYPNVNNASYQSLERLLNYYCDTENISLESILNYIKSNGFYTPYKPTLRIFIE